MTQYEHYELKRIDAEISELESRISLKQEQRREIINRKDLNKNENDITGKPYRSDAINRKKC